MNNFILHKLIEIYDLKNCIIVNDEICHKDGLFKIKLHGTPDYFIELDIEFRLFNLNFKGIAGGYNHNLEICSSQFYCDDFSNKINLNDINFNLIEKLQISKITFLMDEKSKVYKIELSDIGKFDIKNIDEYREIIENL